MSSINAFYRNENAVSYASLLFTGSSASQTSRTPATRVPAVPAEAPAGPTAAQRALAKINEILALGTEEPAVKAGVEERLGYITGATGTKKDDTITLGGRSVYNVSSGAGNDKLDIKSDTVSSVSADDGDDQVKIVGRYLSAISGGDGDDTIDLKGTLALDISGGRGADTIKIAAQTIRGVDGGDGNDTLVLEGTRITASGGKGNDTVTLTQTGKTKGPVEYGFARGDGADVVNSNGAFGIRLTGYTASDLVITSKDNRLTVAFKNSDDKITVNLSDDKGKATAPSYSIGMDNGNLVLNIA